MSIANTIVTVGRRKTAIARVRMVPGTGKITINDREFDNYFPFDSHQRVATGPLSTVEAKDQFDFVIRVNGGGINGQAAAISLGIARALQKHNTDWRSPLKVQGLLKRDPRSRERKKPGQPGARKRFQFSKR